MAKSTMQRTATPVVMMIMIDYGFSNDEVGAIIVLGGRHIFSASANQRGRCKDKKRLLHCILNGRNGFQNKEISFIILVTICPELGNIKGPT